MKNQQFHVDKRSGTSADTLLAVGFAELLAALSGGDVDICDNGSGYILKADIDPESIAENRDPLNLILPIGTKTQVVADSFDYEGQKNQRDVYRQRLNQLPPKLRSPEARLNAEPELVAIDDQRPSELLPLYLVINQMKVASSFNPPILEWRGLPIATKNAILGLLMRLFGTTPNPYDQVSTAWAALAKQHTLTRSMTMLQVVNPTTGKGANRAKADALSIGGMDEWWVLEWLKFVGFFRLAHPQTIRDSKDRKTYVIKPREIGFRALAQIVREFREVAWASSPAKMDVQALLRLIQVLVKNEKTALQTQADFAHRKRKPPCDLIQGCEVTFYKDMGSAFAVMNVAALNIPEWIGPIESIADADRVQTILSEHLAVIQSIRAGDGGERSEEYALLAHYRDFLSSRTVEPLLDFCALFAPYVSRKIERGDYYQRFSVEALTEVFTMQKPLTPIIESPGFQNIANAIRQCTVTLQIDKAQKRPVNFEIRYGLTQELVRRSNHGDDFIAALTEFIAKYNAESAQTLETSKGALKRSRIAQEDLNDIIGLLDAGYRPAVIARLLVAYGTARKSRKPGADSDADSPDAGADDTHSNP